MQNQMRDYAKIDTSAPINWRDMLISLLILPGTLGMVLILQVTLS